MAEVKVKRRARWYGLQAICWTRATVQAYWNSVGWLTQQPWRAGVRPLHIRRAVPGKSKCDGEDGNNRGGGKTFQPS